MAYSGDDRNDVAGVLADRLAAALVHHEPGWRLPRPSALARRYNVRPQQVEQAVRELAARNLIRRLPDGQLYRASPAEYLVPLHGVPRLGARVDPMGGDVACRSKKVSWRRVPEEIGSALGTAGTSTICVIKCHWSVNGDPAAISTTYLTAHAAGQVADVAEAASDIASGILSHTSGQGTDGLGARTPLGVPVALQLEMRPQPPSVTRALRLRAGQAATVVTVRFDEPPGFPAALTVAALRAELFRIVVDSPAAGSRLGAAAASDAFSEIA